MFTDPVIVLPPAFLPSSMWYATMLTSTLAVINTSVRYDKRKKSIHRTSLLDSHGEKHLTVPISRPDSSRTSWESVDVSAHGQWWRTLRSTLATVFGGTPFFEYYRDEFDKELSEDAIGKPIISLDLALDSIIRRILAVPTRLSVSIDHRCGNIIDLTNADFNVRQLSIPTADICLPDELAPGLSVLDPIFRLGGDETRRLLIDSIRPK